MGIVLSDLEPTLTPSPVTRLNYSQLEGFLARQCGLASQAIDEHNYSDALLFVSTALNRLMSEVGPTIPAWEAPEWAMRELTTLNNLQKTLRTLATPFQAYAKSIRIE